MRSLQALGMSSETKERDRFRLYIDVLSDAHDNGRKRYQLNAAEVSELDALVQDRYDRPAVRAQLALRYLWQMPRAIHQEVSVAKNNSPRTHVHEPAPTEDADYGYCRIPLVPLPPSLIMMATRAMVVSNCAT